MTLRDFQSKWDLKSGEVILLPQTLTGINSIKDTSMRTYLSIDDSYADAVADRLDILLGIPFAQLSKRFPADEYGKSNGWQPCDIMELCIIANNTDADLSEQITRAVVTQELINFMCQT